MEERYSRYAITMLQISECCFWIYKSKSTIVNKKHVSAIVKPNNGSSFKSICFNCVNTQVGNYLLFYKKHIDIIGEINENIWNNKKSIQLNIKDLIL